MEGKILVIGSTGTVGRLLVSELVKAGALVRAATRDPATAAARAGFSGGVEVVPFDLELVSTFDGALEGVDRVFLVARPGDEQSDRYAFPLIDAMERRGVCRVVDLSAMGAELRPSFALRRIELRLEASRMAFTHLRPNWFMQVFTGGSLLASIRAMHAIRVPAAAARISWIDARDVASVAAVALGPGRAHEAKAYTLTGGEALDHAEISSVIGGVSGMAVRYEPISDDEARAALKAAGFPEQWVRRLITFYSLVREGYAAPISTAVQDILGRSPRKFADFARENAAVWRA